ncbi:MAG: hypothetical protein EXQ95_12430 [Alphaproteobacteria bacterium]|nr:hypothetical protein [Alphaproteobacteria bacterium]
MEMILKDIERALDAGFHYLAVAAVLTLPDICAALASPKGNTTGREYAKWFDTNLGGQYPGITGTDCYRLRCGVLHQGKFGHPKAPYDRVLFMIPNPGRNIVHKVMMNNMGAKKISALVLDANIFCRDVVQAVRQWFAVAQHDPNVQENLSGLVQHRPQGLAPFVVGLPLIA